MSDLRIVTGKYLEEKLKKGCRLPFFVKSLGTTEEELFEYIDKNFSSKAARSYKKRLKSKGNQQKKSKKKAKEVKTEMIKNVQIEEVNTPKTRLEQLLEEEQKLSDLVCEKESKHSDLISKRANLKNQLVDQRKQVQEIAKKCLQVQQAFEETLKQWNSIGDEMKELSTSISEKRTSLEEIRSEIDSLKKISIFVYTNCEIEFENHGDFDPTVDSEKVAEIFNVLVQNDAAECLTIKSIKQLAKILAIVEKLKAENLRFEITFEDSSMQEVYLIVS